MWECEKFNVFVITYQVQDIIYLHRIKPSASQVLPQS